jgi:hypothetical protein
MPMFIVEKSTSPRHRYQIEVYGKIIRFGSPTMENWWIHGDPKRRENYLKRSKSIINAKGKFTRNYPLSPNYWSRRILWESGEPWLGIDRKYWEILQDQVVKVKKWEQKK